MRRETNDATEAKLVCQIHLFTEGLMDSKDERIREMLYMQTVYNVISGMYPTDKEDALKLASLQFVHKFGELKPETHKPGFLGSKLREFIPIAHINGGTVSGPVVWLWPLAAGAGNARCRGGARRPCALLPACCAR